jgi:N-glycosidase YbiA
MKFTSIIDSFSGEYRWLSNFWIHDLVRQLSVEHHYQAAKTTNFQDWLLVMSAETPAKAKKYTKPIEYGGRISGIRPDWKEVRVPLMEQFTREKYATNADLRNRLLDTQGSLLIEGNTWNDTFWGVCNGVGENNLGKILMRVRDGFLT